MRPLLAVDWGTTSLRGVLIDATGQVHAERGAAQGILSVAPGGFPAVLNEHFGDWLQTPDVLCLIAGMAGSRQGWVEAPYCACPAGFDEIAARLAWVEPGRIAIVPGLVHEFEGTPDVMRGEETQVFGALGLLGRREGLFVLPGTHSKWVQVAAGRIVRFSTAMTGEFYALLRRHSILARGLPESDDDGLDGDAFDAGVRAALADGAGLLHHAFSVRTLGLFDRLAPASAASRLSGLVIGEELRGQALAAGTAVVVIGADHLTERYRRALGLVGVSATIVGSGATWRGLQAVAATLQRQDSGLPVTSTP